MRGHLGTGALACRFYDKDFDAPVLIQYKYKRVGLPPWWYAPVTFFVTDLLPRVAKICNRQAGAVPEYAEKEADPHLQPHVFGDLRADVTKMPKKMRQRRSTQNA